jgi:hypothetical protein
MRLHTNSYYNQHHQSFTLFWYFSSTVQNCSVHPLLKKSNLDKENLSNYQPVSHLSFLQSSQRELYKPVTYSILSSLPALNFTLLRLLYSLSMIASLKLWVSNKSLVSVFLIFLQHLIQLITPSYLSASHLGLVSIELYCHEFHLT